MQKSVVAKHLEELISAFDSDDGLPWSVAAPVRYLIDEVAGDRAGVEFSRLLDGCDGNLFFEDEEAKEECLRTFREAVELDESYE